ncbi:hypothetical protein BDR26DRAFT_666646 [Obelidium mucronatum]|nr:hypothetical protein BDR26DRAFT_666646 [Obelidium mucronatum]
MLHSLPRTSFGDIDGSRCMKLFLQSQQEALTGAELFVVSTFEKVLGLKSTPKSSDDFFEIGGNSLTAGKVMALIRGEYGCKMSPMTLFKNRTAKAMAATIDSNVSANEIKKKPDSLPRSQSTFTRRPPQSQSPTRFLALLVQAMPILFFKPIPIISYWIIFAHFMTWYSMIPFFDAASGKRGTIEGSLSMLAHLVLSGMGAGAVTSLVFPFIGVLAKWVVIGRYHAGSYPLWGQYYLRWWLVDQLLLIFDAGIFRSSDKLFCIYLRMMGAQVVDLSSKIDSKTVIREFDLIQIYPNCAISKSIVRGFTVDAGLMILKPVRIGRGCIINQQSTIAPGAILPPRTILPPRSSSHELEDSSAKHRIFAYNGGPSPSLPFLLFIGYPTVGFVKLIGALPWLACMYWLVQFPFFSDPSDPTFLSVSMFGQFLLHQAQDYRIGIHILRVAVNAAICPFFKMAATILVKKAVIGRFQPGQKTSSQWQTTRHWIMYQLLESGELCGLYNLLGRHYSAISSLYRMLGAKIGKRVYWPGTPMPFYEFDLLDIGDDVVFGSRSQLVFTDNIESRPIMIGPGAMIA